MQILEILENKPDRDTALGQCRLCGKILVLQKSGRYRLGWGELKYPACGHTEATLRAKLDAEKRGKALLAAERGKK